jgi:hypothetical protein
MAATTFAVAAVVAVVAPPAWDSLILAEQRTDGSLGMIAAVWCNNFLLSAGPALVGAAAHVSRRNGHRRLGLWVLIVATALQLRNPLLVGFVGGLDPQWLLQASPWWVLEFVAMTLVCAAAWRAWDTGDGRAAGRVLSRALVLAGAILLCASVVEISLT